MPILTFSWRELPQVIAPPPVLLTDANHTFKPRDVVQLANLVFSQNSTRFFNDIAQTANFVLTFNAFQFSSPLIAQHDYVVDNHLKSFTSDSSTTLNTSFANENTSPLVTPGNPSNYRSGKIGMQLDFMVTVPATGSLGNIYGTDVYQDTSTLAAVAVHSGYFQRGQSGIMRIELRGAQSSYTGSAQNGVTSLNFGSSAGSYAVVFY